MQSTWNLTILLTACIALLSTAANAAQCDGTEQQIFAQDVGVAHAMADTGYNSLPNSAPDGSTAYTYAFGEYTEARKEVVAGTLSQVLGSLVVGNIQEVCYTSVDQACVDGDAQVTSGNPYVIAVCPNYFALEQKKRAALLIHELTHFNINGGTGDACRTNDQCRDLAKSDPDTAVKTAAEYQIYVLSF
jgi:peptidyl-Lys metalloendopeptidase